MENSSHKNVMSLADFNTASTLGCTETMFYNPLQADDRREEQ